MTKHCLFALVLGGLVAACDEGPGTSSRLGAPPVLTSFAYSPDSVDVAALPPDAVEGDVAEVTVTISAEARAGASPVDAVVFSILPPEAGVAPLVFDALAPVEGDRYATEVTLEVPTGQVGLYSIVVYALGADGQASGQARGGLRLFATGGPPVILSAEVVPAVISPPATFSLLATVIDPDGLSNIGRVEGRTADGQIFRLFDDGRTSGDEVAGDSVFTATFSINDAPPGEQTFRVQATDRTGLESDVAEATFTVE